MLPRVNPGVACFHYAKKSGWKTTGDNHVITKRLKPRHGAQVVVFSRNLDFWQPLKALKFDVCREKGENNKRIRVVTIFRRWMARSSNRWMSQPVTPLYPIFFLWSGCRLPFCPLILLFLILALSNTSPGACYKIITRSLLIWRLTQR